MAKKFGKFLLFTAAVGTAAAAVYYYMQKKESADTTPEDDDYDDFSEDLDEDAGASHNYVPLNHESKPASEPEKDAEPEKKEDAFTPLNQVAKAAEKTEESVEEFFDEEDDTAEEPPIQDN